MDPVQLLTLYARSPREQECLPASSVCAMAEQARTCASCRAERPDNPHRDAPIAARAYERHYGGLLEGIDPAHDLGQTVLTAPRSEPVQGWRLWSVGVDHRGPVLLAPFRPDPTYLPAVWQQGPNQSSSAKCWGSSCRRVQHPAPSCYCGIRSMTSLAALLRFWSDQRDRIGPLVAFAEVDMWGTVTGGARGDDWSHTLRASWAEIRGPLYLADHHLELGKRYGVETAHVDDRVEWA